MEIMTTPTDRVRAALEDIVHAAFEHGNKCLSGKTLDPDGELLGAAKEALHELEGKVLVKDWQPIETAPKDEYVLIKTPFYECRAFFDTADGEWFFPRYNNEYWEVTEPVLNWMPLPDAPYVEGEKE